MNSSVYEPILCAHARRHKHVETAKDISWAQEALNIWRSQKDLLVWLGKGPEPVPDNINTFHPNSTSLSHSKCNIHDWRECICHVSFSPPHLDTPAFACKKNYASLGLTSSVSNSCINKQPKMPFRRKGDEEKWTCLITQFLLIFVNYWATLPWESTSTQRSSHENLFPSEIHISTRSEICRRATWQLETSENYWSRS